MTPERHAPSRLRAFFYVEWRYWLLGIGWRWLDTGGLTRGVTLFLGPLRLTVEKCEKHDWFAEAAWDEERPDVTFENLRTRDD